MDKLKVYSETFRDWPSGDPLEGCVGATQPRILQDEAIAFHGNRQQLSQHVQHQTQRLLR